MKSRNDDVVVERACDFTSPPPPCWEELAKLHNVLVVIFEYAVLVKLDVLDVSARVVLVVVVCVCTSMYTRTQAPSTHE